MRTPPLLADFTHPRACKPICEKSLTLPRSQIKRQILSKVGGTESNLSILSIGIASIGLYMPQFQSTSYTGVDFFAAGRKNKLVEGIAFVIIF